MKNNELRKPVGLILIVILLVTGVCSSVAHAWSTQNLQWVSFDSSSIFRNYDFESDTDSSSNVDWAVSVVFWGPVADVDNAKSLLWSHTGDTMKLHYDIAGNDDFDSDKGRKSDSTDMNGWHARIYAPSDNDYFYSYPLGRFVVATTHRDWLIHWPWSQTGYTSRAADEVIAKAAQTVGQGDTYERFTYMYNTEPYREEGPWIWRHVWEHDGWARGVYMN